LIPIRQAECKVLEAVAVVVGDGLLRRHIAVGFGDDQRLPERAVAVADQDCRPAPVEGDGHDQILDRVAVEVGDVYVRAVDAERVRRERQRRLPDERPVADTKEAIDA